MPDNRSIMDLFDEHVLQPTYRMLNLPGAVASGVGDVATGLEPRTAPGPGGMPSLPMALLNSIGGAFMNQRGPIQAVPEWMEQITPPGASGADRDLIRGAGGAFGVGAEIASPGPGEIKMGAMLPFEEMARLHAGSRLKRPVVEDLITPDELAAAGMKRPPKGGEKIFTASPERHQELFQKGASTPFGLSFYPKEEMTDPEYLERIARVGDEDLRKMLSLAYEVTSWNRTPRVNALLAAQALDDYRAAKAMGVEPTFRGVTGSQADALRSIPHGGLTREEKVKTFEFSDANKGRKRAFVPDVMEARIFGMPDSPSKFQQRVMINRGRTMADDLGLDPIDLQQGEWAGLRTEAGRGGQSEPLWHWLNAGLMDPPGMSPFGDDRYRQMQQILFDQGSTTRAAMEAALRRRAQQGPPTRR